MRCLMQVWYGLMHLCPQRGLCWRRFWKWSCECLGFDVYCHPGQPSRPEGSDSLTSRADAQNSTPLCWRHHLGKEWKMWAPSVPPSSTQDTSAGCSVPATDVLWLSEGLDPSKVGPLVSVGQYLMCLCNTLKNWGIKKLLKFWPFWSLMSHSEFPSCYVRFMGNQQTFEINFPCRKSSQEYFFLSVQEVKCTGYREEADFKGKKFWAWCARLELSMAAACCSQTHRCMHMSQAWFSLAQPLDPNLYLRNPPQTRTCSYQSREQNS